MIFQDFNTDQSNSLMINVSDLHVDCEEEKNIKKIILERYLLDFRRFDSESLYPWGDLTNLIESF